MGWPPSEIRWASLAEIIAAHEGWAGFHAGEGAKPPPMTRDEFEALAREYW